MILGPIAYVDCVVFIIFLIPQLLLHVNWLELLVTGLRALPSLGIIIPISFVAERYFTPKRNQSLHVQRSRPFQDFVVRYVRYAFANMSARIGRVFFSKNVAIPFTKFRMLRKGMRTSPIKWEEIDERHGKDRVRGLLIKPDFTKEADVVVYYCHGGGFSMGSPYFYLEPHLVLVSLLQTVYKNPALFSLDYDLVPDKVWPTQLEQIVAGYKYAHAIVSGDASRICVAGDSAGGTLVLSLLLALAKNASAEEVKPGYATLLSPWVTLVSGGNQDTKSDFLNAKSLHLYASEYAGTAENLYNPRISPGCCKDLSLWKLAAPSNGFYFSFGSEEVLATEAKALIRLLRKASVPIRVREEPGGVHAWVIASLFLSDTFEERIFGMREVVKAIAANIKPTAGLINGENIERARQAGIVK